ncbi:hypothetical protein HYALB_00005678 [Hymenoscyphus albidus]|uniref:Ubiquitin-like domain-containing protein n=1 Tax=Hymenoscyphus albidus TaxID=595503 RepID=A0A9N9LKE0_9HELO|nr:hypothetical protein HYALB_00005678 [Hymenoscyphus albidus]
MPEASEAVDSIVGIVNFGLRLATTLQTYVETALEAEERMRDITFDINSTASALKQLQDIIEHDKADDNLGEFGTRVFKDEGRREIEAIAHKCGKIYRTVVLLVNKASTSGFKKVIPVASSEIVHLKVSSLTRMKWPWVEPHIKRCQEQLRWLKMSLLFNLQLASLARSQLRYVFLIIRFIFLTSLSARDKMSKEDELQMKKMVISLREKEIKTAKLLIGKPEKSQPSTVSSVPSSGTSRSSAPPSSQPGLHKSLTSNSLVKDRSLHDEYSLTETGNMRRPNIKVKSTLYQPISDTFFQYPADLSKIEPERPRISNAVSVDGIIKSEEQLSQQPDFPSVDEEANLPLPDALGSCHQLPAPARGRSIDSSQHSRYSAKSKALRLKRLPSQFRNIFSPRRKSHDWESESLEAFALLNNSTSLIKVHFGDRGLRQLMQTLNVSPDTYASLDSHQIARIDSAILDVKLLDSREKMCLGVGVNPKVRLDAIFIFFSLGDHVEPIYFTDFLGRELLFPPQFFRSWDKSNQEFIKVFQHMGEVGRHVSDGFYDIIDEKGNILTPNTIKSLVEPGSRLGMRMWAKPEMDLHLIVAEKEAINKAKTMADNLIACETETEGSYNRLRPNVSEAGHVPAIRKKVFQKMIGHLHSGRHDNSESNYGRAAKPPTIAGESGGGKRLLRKSYNENREPHEDDDFGNAMEMQQDLPHPYVSPNSLRKTLATKASMISNDEPAMPGDELNGDSKPVKFSAPDADTNLDLDFTHSMENLNIRELLGRYTNAIDTAIEMKEDGEVPSY